MTSDRGGDGPAQPPQGHAGRRAAIDRYLYAPEAPLFWLVGLGVLALVVIILTTDSGDGASRFGSSAGVGEASARADTVTGPTGAEGFTAAGDLLLRVIEVTTDFDAGTYDDTSDANTRVRVVVQAVLGTSQFLASAPFALEDDRAVSHPALQCGGCPEPIDAALAIGGLSMERSLYFALPEGRTPAALLYVSDRSATPVRIPLE